MEFLKKFWAQILLVVAAVLGVLAMILGNRKKTELPERPKLDDVKIPDVNVNPADDYTSAKKPVTTEAVAVVDELNARHR